MSLFSPGLPDATDDARSPATARVAGTLRIECLNSHVRRRLCEQLEQAGIIYTTEGESLSVRTEDLDALALELSARLTANEQLLARATFSPKEDGRAPESGGLRRLLRGAQGRWVAGLLRPGNLRMVFQPVVRCGRNEVYGFEALLRAADTNDAVAFQPSRAFAAARESGLASQLDGYARRAAFADAARYGVSTKLFVNVTPGSLCAEEHCVDAALRELDLLRMSPHQIVFELIESEPVSDWKSFGATVMRYRECGFQIALDDFGVAYSSPMTLCNLRPDYVKLDRALVGGVHLDAGRASFVRKLIEAARTFGARLIAEGVESEGEYRWVLEQGVDYAQGFYISRPAAPPPFMSRELTALVS